MWLLLFIFSIWRLKGLVLYFPPREGAVIPCVAVPSPRGLVSFFCGEGFPLMLMGGRNHSNRENEVVSEFKKTL